MSPQRISKHIASLLRVSRISRQLRASSLFKPADYCQLIPGLGEKPLKAYVHAIRHGIRHSAFLSRDPIAAWLLPEIILKRISGVEAKQISRNIQRGAPIDSTIVNIADYYCTAAYLKADFARCLELLAQTSPHYRLKFCHLMLRGPFASKDIKPFMEPLHRHFADGLCKGDVDAHKIYRDLCVADGRNLQDIAALTRKMTELANRKPNASNFYLGFQGTDHAPITAKVDYTYGDYAVFQDVAAQNALKSDDYLALKKTNNVWEAAAVNRHNCVAVTIPPPEIWVNTSPFAMTVKESFKGLLRLLGDKTTIIPILFPYARDITRLQLPCARLISYHTFAEGRDDILHYKESAFKGLCAFDNFGYSGGAQEASMPAKIKRHSSAPSPSIISYQNLHKKGYLSKYTQTSGSESSETERIVGHGKTMLLALQISDDSASRWHNMSAVEMVRACCEIVQDVSQTKDVSILIKPHPKDSFQPVLDNIKDIAETYSNVELTREPLEALLEKSDLVITANSGVGLEALLYGKAVITTGLSEYRQASHYAPDLNTLKASIQTALGEADLQEDFYWVNNFFETMLWNGQDKISDNHIIAQYIRSMKV